MLKSTPCDKDLSRSRPYVFYFPYRGVGGVPVLFLRIAEWLAQNTDHPLYLIDYEDGFMAKIKKNPKIQLLVFEADLTLTIPTNAILIFQSDLPWGLPRNLILDNTVTAFFWNCYPFNLVPVLPGSGRDWMSKSLFRTKFLLNTLLLPSKIKCRLFLENLLQKNAVAFMDEPNIQFTEKALGIKIVNPALLPILLPETSEKAKTSNLTDRPLVAAWVGRLADFKIYSLIYTLKNISEWTIRSNRQFIFKVIGDGGRIDELTKALPENSKFKIELLGSKSSEALESILINDVDILFAMGTSALEGARLALPTVLLDFSYGPFPNYYKFKWVFNSRNFSLGSPLDLIDFSEGSEIDKVMDELTSKVSEIKSNCLKYFLDHHAIDKSMSKFLKMSQGSEFVYTEYLSSAFVRKPTYYKLWAFVKHFFRP